MHERIVLNGLKPVHPEYASPAHRGSGCQNPRLADKSMGDPSSDLIIPRDGFSGKTGSSAKRSQRGVLYYRCGGLSIVILDGALMGSIDTSGDKKARGI